MQSLYLKICVTLSFKKKCVLSKQISVISKQLMQHFELKLGVYTSIKA